MEHFIISERESFVKANFILDSKRVKIYNTYMNQPIITTTENEIIIRIPKGLLGNFGFFQKPKKKPKVDWSWMIGVLADDPSLKGKTSVEVQHETKDLWLKTD